MGVIARIFDVVFGEDRNLVRDTVEVFQENSEAGARREALIRQLTLKQFGEEFAQPSRSRFDRIVDGLNRLPRPFLALGTLGLFVSAMVQPVWFAERMQGIALVPEPLWWLLGAIISFYFGARHQVKSQEFQHQIAGGLMRAAQVTENIKALRALREGALVPQAANAGHEGELISESLLAEPNAALEHWQGRVSEGR